MSFENQSDETEEVLKDQIEKGGQGMEEEKSLEGTEGKEIGANVEWMLGKRAKELYIGARLQLNRPGVKPAILLGGIFALSMIAGQVFLVDHSVAAVGAADAESLGKLTEHLDAVNPPDSQMSGFHEAKNYVYENPPVSTDELKRVDFETLKQQVSTEKLNRVDFETLNQKPVVDTEEIKMVEVNTLNPELNPEPVVGAKEIEMVEFNTIHKEQVSVETLNPEQVSVETLNQEKVDTVDHKTLKELGGNPQGYETKVLGGNPQGYETKVIGGSHGNNDGAVKILGGDHNSQGQSAHFDKSGADGKNSEVAQTGGKAGRKILAEIMKSKIIK